MLLVDTGPLVAYLTATTPTIPRCADLLTSRTDELLVTPNVVTEACSLVGTYLGADAEINLVEALAAGDLTQLDTPAADLHRMAALMRRHRDFPLGVTDASVVAAAERLGLTEVATLDRRHFHAITPTHIPAVNLLSRPSPPAAVGPGAPRRGSRQDYPRLSRCHTPIILRRSDGAPGRSRPDLRRMIGQAAGGGGPTRVVPGRPRPGGAGRSLKRDQGASR